MLYETRLSHPTRSLPAVASRLRLNRILKPFWENNECRLFAFCIADQNGHPKLMLVFCQNSLFVQDRRHSSNFPFLSSCFSVRLPFYLTLAAMDPSSDGDGECFTVRIDGRDSSKAQKVISIPLHLDVGIDDLHSNQTIFHPTFTMREYHNVKHDE